METLDFPAFDDFDLDDREQALAAYFMRLEFLAPKLEQELIDASTTWQACEDLEVALQGEFDAMVQAGIEHARKEPPQEPGGIGRASLQFIYTPGAAIGELRVEALRLLAESAAGALLLIIDEVIQRLRHETPDPATGNVPQPSEFGLGTLGMNDHVSTLIYAAGNAYRHAKDWDGLVAPSGTVNLDHPAYKRALWSIELLRHSIDLARVFQGSACVAAVECLTQDRVNQAPFGVLWRHLNEVGRQYADEYCHGAESFEKVLAALDAQDEYTRFEVSFSDNEQLWGTQKSAPNADV